MYSRPAVPALVSFALASILLPAILNADPIQLVAADAHGVTLRLTVPAWRLDTPADPLAVADQRRLLVAAGFSVADLPGRPQLPYASTLVALPPGATAAAHVIASTGA